MPAAGNPGAVTGDTDPKADDADRSVRAAKRNAGERAAEEVPDGAVVGLGTGSTAAHAIRTLGERAGDRTVRGVPTSRGARATAVGAGIEVVGLDEVDEVDVAVDGADQATLADGTLVKGGGGAHAREKVVDTAADRFVVVVDPRKVVDRLSAPVPVAVLPAARAPVADAVRELGGTPRLRAADRKDGPVVTDDGHLLLDCEFGPLEDPADLATALSTTPGVVEHGLFVRAATADRIHVGRADGVETHDPG